MRPLAAHSQALGHGRVGGLRLLRLAFALVLGAAAVPDLHPGRDAILWALADPKIGEREILAAMLDVEPQLATARPGLALITDKGFAGHQPEAAQAAGGITLLRPSRKDGPTRHGEPLLKSVRQLIESVNDTLKGQLDLEAHGGRTFEGVAI